MVKNVRSNNENSLSRTNIETKYFNNNSILYFIYFVENVERVNFKSIFLHTRQRILTMNIFK